MKIYIKYMVSLRCKLMVKHELEKLDIPFVSIELGMVELKEAIPDKILQESETTRNKCRAGPYGHPF
jgi:hypothetical protein